MLSPPFLEHEEQQFEVLTDNYLAPVLRDERYDRIARTAMRLLEIPMAFVAVVEGDTQWLRSVQGIPAHQTNLALAFCDPKVLQDRMLLVPDTCANPLFWHNPLVTGAPRVRSFLSVPLARAPGVSGGTLCALHTAARAFCTADVLALQDLARLAESELRLDAMTAVHKRVVTRLGQLERRVRLARSAAPG